MTTTSEDTEITLGTGKMLVLFFGLVALCAVFFAAGFAVGKNAARLPVGSDSSPTVTSGGSRPSGAKTPETKVVQPKDSSTPAAAPQPVTPSDSNPPQPAASAAQAQPQEPTAAPSAISYYVQVAAVTKQEDADALVDALKKKQYPAFTNTGAADRLFHVQVGPFENIQDAEATRSRLMADGYNPILKK